MNELRADIFEASKVDDVRGSACRLNLEYPETSVKPHEVRCFPTYKSASALKIHNDGLEAHKHHGTTQKEPRYCYDVLCAKVPKTGERCGCYTQIELCNYLMHQTPVNLRELV